MTKTASDRPKIPAAIRRAVLVESGHKCAIPRCDHGDVDIHHIVPWETCGKHEYQNLISLCPNHHRKAHKGEIDRKSLKIYKNSLVAAFRISGEPLFSAPAIEIKRRIYEVDPASSDCIFTFEFPDFVNPMTRIISKNIEAWGYELLAAFHLSQDAEHRKNPIKLDYPVCWLIGHYQVIRRDASVISVLYDVEQMAFGAAHRSHETRVQNFFVSPFAPVSLEELLISPEAVKPLERAVRKKLIDSGLDVTDVELGAASEIDKFARFVVGYYGFTFYFDDYEVASYAQGRQHVEFEFDELVGIFKPGLLDRLAHART